MREGPRSWYWPTRYKILLVVAITVGIAELAGAANLGVAVGIGQVTFAIVLVVLLLRA